MSAPKFSFVPEKQMNAEPTESGYRVKIRKNFVLYFPVDVVDIYSLEGKYAKFYVDVQKRTLGWSIIEGKTEMDDLADARLMKSYDLKSKSISFGIGKLMKAMGFTKYDEFDHLDVRKYVSPLAKDEIWYVTLDK